LESEHFQSLAQIVSGHAQKRGSRDAIIYLERGESETERISYRELVTLIDSFCAGLLAAGLAGEPIMIALPGGIPFIALFLACLRIGTVAVPAPLPDNDRNIARIAAMLADCRPAAIVTDDASSLRLARADPSTPIAVIDELRKIPVAAPAQSADPSRIAFVQYTSGSTRNPKGVAVTHGNLIANTRMIQQAFGLNESLIGANWLPHFHDMGLIGTILQPLFNGGTAVLMPPRAFVQKPLRWLQAIEKYRSDTAGGPCFGYELCTRMISAEQARTLDLSSWRVAFCGAEPVRASVLEKFAEHFAGAGFRAEAFLPCYGLAETTLITSAAAPSTGVAQKEIVIRGATALRRNVVSCGSAVEGSSIVLRDESGHICRCENELGEICVRGPHVSPGHWYGVNRSVTPFADVFVHGGAEYLPTGDIGAFVDGELFPIDRISDIIILFGANIHAADVEATALDDPEAPDVRAAAAFAVDDGNREKLVLLCELDRQAFRTFEHGALAEYLRKRVAEEHGVVPLIGFVVYGTLPRTSSGKIQRSASRRSLLSDDPPIIRVDNETETLFSELRRNAHSHAKYSV
jgi:acyl-CoA synthetase (AMP-forming)/AMP-acid ligase II